MYYGVDLAAVQADLRDDPDEATIAGALVIPRADIELGGPSLRFRLGIDISLGLGRVHDREPDLVVPIDTRSVKLIGGFDLETGVVAQF